MEIIMLLLIGIALACSIVSYNLLNRTFKQMDEFIDTIEQNNMELDRYNNELFHGDK